MDTADRIGRETSQERHYWERPKAQAGPERAMARRVPLLRQSQSDSRLLVHRDVGITEPAPKPAARRRPAIRTYPPPPLPDPRPRTRQPSEKTRQPAVKQVLDKKPPPSNPVKAGPIEYETIYTSATTKDVTVHLEVDVFADIDDELEHLNRCMRIGDFRSAKTLFHNHLQAHSHEPSVFVQYAEMLLEMGDYKSLALLDDSSTFSTTRPSGGLGTKSDWQSLETNWRLIRAVALSRSQHELRPIWRELGPPQDGFPASGDVTSTAV